MTFPFKTSFSALNFGWQDCHLGTTELHLFLLQGLQNTIHLTIDGMIVFLQLKQIRLCTIINNYTTEMEELKNVKEKIAELIASESINFDEREILELLLKANPEKCAELYFFMKISERLGRIEKRLRYIDDNTDKNRVVSVQIVG